MKICVVGGGNIGTAMCSYIKKNINCNLVLKTSKPQKWNGVIEYVDKESKKSYESKIDYITNNAKEAFDKTDLILITLPSFLIKGIVEEMTPYLKEGCIIGVIPGSGGCEFYFKDLINKGIIFFGMDRVPCVSRIEVYGRKVVASKKGKTRAAVIPKKETKKVCQVLSNIFGMEVAPLKNYLTVTFTPSNQIVHTARLFSMFKDATDKTNFDSQILFYGEWDDDASEIMLKCDRELHEICDAFKKLDLTEVIPLLKHYEVDTIHGLTQKIKSIKSMNAILSPLIVYNNYYRIDLNSRYFIEDFPYGLCIIKGFAVITKVNTPYIDNILKWYEKLNKKKYFVEGEFKGKDLENSAIPQNFGIKNMDDVYEFYK